MISAKLRAAAVTLLALAATALLLLLIHQTVLPVVAWLFPILEPAFYDIAVYGAYPTQRYVSFDLPAPWPNLLRWDASCDTGHVLLSPNGPSVEYPGPIMLDARGDLVWMTADFGTTTNFKVQSFDGQDYLTFWAGRKDGSQGEGAYYMLDSSYNLVRKVEAVGQGKFGDLHEFQLTNNGTALMTVYHTTPADLSPMGWGHSANGWITDSLFQELDLKTGALLFEWKASEHFDPGQSFYFSPFTGYSKGSPFDSYHLNSIDKDRNGNYLISSRHTHSVALLDPTGNVLWVLGGPLNQFMDLSDGEATNFLWQHDARWLSEDEGLIGLFDNGGAGPMQKGGVPGKGRIIKLDVENRTATLVQTYHSLNNLPSASQGSLQYFPESDHVFVGFGSAGAYSEFDRNGDLLCETHIGASALFWWERVKSYRSIKVLNWVGAPDYPPDAKIVGHRIYVSWNGATEVSAWELQGEADADDQGGRTYDEIEVIDKTSFESSFELPDSSKYSQYRVLALDRHGDVLGTSDPVLVSEATPSSSSSKTFKSIFGVCALAGLVIGSWLFATKVLRYRRKNNITSWKMYRYSELSS